MIKTTKEKIIIYQSEKISSFGGVGHFFSTRSGGISTGVFNSLNFGTHHGEAENMIKNLALLKESLQCSGAKFVIPHQTHSDIVAVIDHSNIDDTFENTDAFITNLHDIFICIKTADCVPILLFDPIKKVVGAVHAGWRGTAQNIVGKTIAKMGVVYGCSPAHIVAAIGPCIGQPNYEVGSEVIESIKPLIANPEKAFTAIVRSTGKSNLNLTEANHQLLAQAGIHPKNIEPFELCTHTHSKEFFSARRDGHKTGRMINGIALL
jgi:YfiH family protein